MNPSEFFHPLLTKFQFQLVKQFEDESFSRSLYINNQITILVTEGKFGAYWQTVDEFGYWCTLEKFLTNLIKV